MYSPQPDEPKVRPRAWSDGDWDPFSGLGNTNQRSRHFSLSNILGFRFNIPSPLYDIYLENNVPTRVPLTSGTVTTRSKGIRVVTYRQERRPMPAGKTDLCKLRRTPRHVPVHSSTPRPPRPRDSEERRSGRHSGRVGGLVRADSFSYSFTAGASPLRRRHAPRQAAWVTGEDLSAGVPVLEVNRPRPRGSPSRSRPFRRSGSWGTVRPSAGADGTVAGLRRPSPPSGSALLRDGGRLRGGSCFGAGPCFGAEVVERRASLRAVDAGLTKTGSGCPARLGR